MVNLSTLIISTIQPFQLPFHCSHLVSGAQPSATVTLYGTAEGGREEDDSSVSNQISEEELQLEHEQEKSHFKNKKRTTLTP